MRKLILGSIVAAAVGSAALPAAARTNVDFYVNIAPPPVYAEAVPVPRAGFVWVPGYWDWRYNRHYWVAGHWVRARPGHYHYAPARWRDADRDGVPNRYDRAPTNPYYR